MFLGKTLCSHSASLQLGVEMGTGEHTAGGNLAMDSVVSHPGGSRKTPT